MNKFSVVMFFIFLFSGFCLADSQIEVEFSVSEFEESDDYICSDFYCFGLIVVILAMVYIFFRKKKKKGKKKKGKKKKGKKKVLRKKKSKK